MTPGEPQSVVKPPARLRLRVVGCEVLARPIYLCAARSPHVVDVTLQRRGLHDTPATLRQLLQAAIDEAADADPPYDAVVLGYGLCGGAIAGLRATGIPLVVARAHDCITLFLGNRARYDAECTSHPGTYWYATDYLERTGRSLNGATTGLLGLGSSSPDELQSVYADYIARFGKDNADYLMECMGAWREHYDRAIFINMGIVSTPDAERRARAEAEQRHWLFELMTGDLLLIRNLLDGNWTDDFIVLQPGQRLAMTYDAQVVRADDAKAEAAG